VPSRACSAWTPGRLSGSSGGVAQASTRLGPTFECRLKGKHAPERLRTFLPCTSPTKYKDLEPGRYRFAVRSTDPSGNLDPTAAKSRFRRVEP
jgi:hypothetical protein